MNKFDTFLQLHYNDGPLLIGNVWDVASAKVFEQCGFNAVATSSAAVAITMGYEDGENIPFEKLLQTAGNIISNIKVPLSVDIEAGFSRNIPQIIENVEKLYAIGVVGINIEDSIKGVMQPVAASQKVIASIAGHLAKNNMRMFINARTDAFLVKQPGALTETVTRVKAYDNAGASGIFVPFVTNNDDIAAIVNATKLPVNVFASPQLPGFAELAALGVKRISMGRAVYYALIRWLQNTITTIQEEQSFKSLY